MRQIALLGHYVATTCQDGLQIHQYIASEISANLSSENAVKIRLETSYPWEGKVKLTIEETAESAWELALRIPSWCEGASVQIDDQPVDVSAAAGGYVRYQRTWQSGDTIQLDLRFSPRFIQPNPRVDAIRGNLAIAYGPLVYCFEGVDQPAGVNLSDVRVRSDAPLKAIWQEGLLGKIMGIKAQGVVEEMSNWEGALYRRWSSASPHSLRCQDLELTAVPYYAWANRGPGTMRVWLPCL
jgi:DUF1680 family protein